MTEVTQILAAIEQGDPKAAEQLLPLVYNELRSLAIQKLGRVPPGQTLQPTRPGPRGLSAAAGRRGGEALGQPGPLLRRRVPRRSAHSGGARPPQGQPQALRATERADFDVDELCVPELREDLHSPGRGPPSRLATADSEAARLVQLRYFAGLTLAEAAKVMDVSPRTADRLWAYARAWLHQALEGGGSKAQRFQSKMA